MGFWEGLLDLIYPWQQHCLNCGRRLFAPEIVGLCTDCLREIAFARFYCSICGRIIPEQDLERVCHQTAGAETQEVIGEGDTGKCPACRQSSGYNFTMARSTAVYQGIIRELILRFKYYHRLEIQNTLGQLLAIYYHYYYDGYGIKYVVPVPLHPARRKVRGYNQTALLGDSLAGRCRLSLLPQALTRTRNSRPLFELGPGERQKVIEGSFARGSLSAAEQIRGQHVLLVDDIFTTGTTVNEASRVLREECGASAVYVLTVATGTVRS